MECGDEEIDDDIMVVKEDFTPIHDLPDEILDYLFAFLTLRDRIRTEMVCKRWRWFGKCRPWSWPKKLILENTLPAEQSDHCMLKYFNTTSRELEIKPPVQNYFDIQTGISLGQQPCRHLSLLLSRCGATLMQLELGRWDCHDQVLSDKTLEITANCCPNLVAIKVVDMPLRSSNMKILAQCCTKLRNVHLLNGAEIDEETLALLFKACQALECFDVQYCWKLVIGKCFDVINMNLKTIRLKECRALEPAAMKRLMTRCACIQELCLTNCCLLDEITLLQIFNRYKETLKVLRVEQYSGRNEWYEGMEALHNLRELSVSGCTYVGDKLCLIIAKHCLKVKVLNLSNTSITDVGICLLASATCLTELDISETRIHGRGIKDLAMQRRLEKLNAATCPYVANANATFGFLAECCPNLNDLDVSGIRGVSNWLVDTFCQAIDAGLLKGPLNLIVSDTCITDNVEVCKGLNVVGNTYWEPTSHVCTWNSA